MSPLTFYRQQASEQSLAADTATLANVRERCQRAMSAWTALAERIQRADDARALANPAERVAEPNENPDRGFATASAPQVGG